MEKSFNPTLAIKRLKERGIGNYVCPFCNGNEFAIQEEVATILMSKDYKSMNLGHYIPAAILICNKCGNMSFFALGVLGMIDKGDMCNGEEG